MRNKEHRITIGLKLLICVFLILVTSLVNAQSPSLINYQGTARLSDGTPLDNRTISIKFDLLQGSSSGSVIATESKTLQTNALGLFSTLLGQGMDLSAINWQGNTIFLQVSMDTSAGSSFVPVGVQQMVSVPYAIHASSVPTSYTNNILTIGSSTYALAPTVAVVPNTSLTVSGLGTVTSAGTNTFDINIPAPTFSGQGATTVNGAYPNYTISSATPSIALSATAATGPSVTSSGSSFSLNVPPPTFSNTGQTIITGSYPDFIVNTPTVGATPITTINASGLVTISNPATNSFVVGVPAPTLGIASGSISITGGNSVALPTTPSVTAAGMATVSTGPNYVVGVPAQSLSIASGSISITSGNSVTLPTTPSVTAAGIATVSAGPNYVLGVQAPVFTNGGQAIISGTYPNYSVNTPTIANTSIALTTTAAAGPSLSTIGTNSFNLNIPPGTDWSLLGNAGTSTVNNFIGTTDNVALNFRVNNQRSGSIDPVLQNSYFGYQSGLNNTTGNSNAGHGYLTLSANTTGNSNAALGYRALSANTTGNANSAFGSDAMLSNTSGIFNVAAGLNALRANTTGDGNVAYGRDALHDNVSGSYNIAIGHQAGYTSLGTSNVFIGSGAGYYETGSNKLYVSNSSTSVTPLIYGDFTNGRMGINTTTLGAYNLNIHDAGTSSALRMTNSATSGLGFVIGNNNTNVSILNYENTSLFFGTNGANRMVISNTGDVGLGTVTPSYKLDVVGTGGPRLRVFSQDGYFAGLLAKNNTHEYFIGIQADYESAGGTVSGFHIFDNTAGARRMVIDDIGRMGINTSAPTATLHVTGTTRLVDGTQGAGKVLTSDASGNASWQNPVSGGWDLTGNAGTTAGTDFIGTTDAQDLVFKTNSNEVFRATAAGDYILSPPNTAAVSTQTLYMPAKTTNISGNSLMIKGGNAGTGGQARSGGNIIIEGGDGWHINSFSYLMGGITLRTGKNLGVGSGNQNGGVIKFENHNGSNTLYEMARFDISGNFGIGVTAPAYQLELSLNSAGKPTSNVWTTTSDARLKTNVHDYKEGLAEILKINPVWFTYTGEAEMPRETGVGVIAQDLQKIAPYMIKEWEYTPKDSDGKPDYNAAKTNYLGVDNGPMTYMLINAVKEQQKQIEELKRQNEEQDELIQELLNKH